MRHADSSERKNLKDNPLGLLLKIHAAEIAEEKRTVKNQPAFTAGITNRFAKGKVKRMKFFGTTDIGSIRKTNQDCFLIKEIGEGILVCAVFDGMGGAAGGGEASGIAKEAFESYLCEFFAGKSPDKISLEEAQAAIGQAADRANLSVYSRALGTPELSGMGTTLVSVLFIGDCVYTANVGDSRMYIISETQSVQHTRDHSFVQFLVDTGKITPEEARNHPQKNLITRAVGTKDEISVDVTMLKKSDLAGKYILLCSDGLSNFVTDEEMRTLVCDDLEKSAAALVARANEAGGADNITVVLIKI